MYHETSIRTIPVMYENLFASFEVGLSRALHLLCFDIEEGGNTSLAMVRHIPEGYERRYGFALLTTIIIPTTQRT